MATPITHVALTAKVFDKFFPEKRKKDFFVGTCFPDIRNLKVIKREETHFLGLKITDLALEDSFMAGLKFHSILDIYREKFIVENSTYDLCNGSKYIIHSVKLFEDLMFYESIENWGEYIGYLDEVLPEQISMGIEKVDILKWHSILKQYFGQKPTQKTIARFISSIGHPPEVIAEIIKDVEMLKRNKGVIGILKDLYENFDKLIVL